ncbi:hypothetical protein NQ117_23600 [Paenibacillus sp. SC116]|uniref:hypothetical protein n=1 Tax=Paenibacillus sp. SC116 TaxID=2968986 RepID=UPI00215ACD42|nr:hypothetical protein [Paenibacillus sp. SC116]MCR8846673.1 hypothetical protein [Paenibacillus sp. SC116]
MQPPQERTFYHYKLLRKIKYGPWVNRVYILLGFAAWMAALWAEGFIGLIYGGLAWLILFWIHYVIPRSLFVIDRYHYRKRWGFQFRLPWIGFLPYEKQFVGFHYWMKVLLYITLIGSLIIGVMSIWLPIGFTLQFLFWHIWFLGPRWFATIVALSISDDKLIKLGVQEFSIYKA